MSSSRVWGRATCDRALLFQSTFSALFDLYENYLAKMQMDTGGENSIAIRYCEQIDTLYTRLGPWPCACSYANARDNGQAFHRRTEFTSFNGPLSTSYSHLVTNKRKIIASSHYREATNPPVEPIGAQA